MDRQSEIRYLGQSKNKYYLQIESDYSLFVFLLFGNSNQKCFCLVPWHRVLIHHYLPIYYLQTHLKILFLDGHDLNWSCPKARFGLLAFTVRWKYRNIFIGLLSKANFDVKYMDRAVKVKNMKKALFLSSVHSCFDVLPREDLSILQLLF